MAAPPARLVVAAHLANPQECCFAKPSGLRCATLLPRTRPRETDRLRTASCEPTAPGCSQSHDATRRTQECETGQYRCQGTSCCPSSVQTVNASTGQLAQAHSSASRATAA